MAFLDWVTGMDRVKKQRKKYKKAVRLLNSHIEYREQAREAVIAQMGSLQELRRYSSALRVKAAACIETAVARRVRLPSELESFMRDTQSALSACRPGYATKKLEGDVNTAAGSAAFASSITAGAGSIAASILGMEAVAASLVSAPVALPILAATLWSARSKSDEIATELLEARADVEETIEQVQLETAQFQCVLARVQEHYNAMATAYNQLARAISHVDADDDRSLYLVASLARGLASLIEVRSL